MASYVDGSEALDRAVARGKHGLRRGSSSKCWPRKLGALEELFRDSFSEAVKLDVTSKLSGGLSLATKVGSKRRKRGH